MMGFKEDFLPYEEQYMKILQDIYNYGYQDGTNERTGVLTKRLPCRTITVDVEEEFPILKSKQVFWKTALKEIEWIWKDHSSKLSDLDAHIWDSWADSEGTIGKAYGAQIAKPVNIFLDPVTKNPDTFRSYENQAAFVIEYLKENPNGRWANVTLWNVDDLSKMNLVPCCHTATFNLDGGRLNLTLSQRSGDMPYGVPFNTTQYAMLMVMIAKELNVRPGIMVHTIADAHIYANQMAGVKQQIAYYKLMKSFDDYLTTTHNFENLHKIRFGSVYGFFLDEFDEVIKTSKENGIDVNPKEIFEKVKECIALKPRFVINTDKSFFDYRYDSCGMIGYKSMGTIKFGDVIV